MSITQLLIKKMSDDSYEIVYYKSSQEIQSVDAERNNSIRFIDDAVDCFLRRGGEMSYLPTTDERLSVVFEVGHAKG
jgi:hypothetical protein